MDRNQPELAPCARPSSPTWSAEIEADHVEKPSFLRKSPPQVELDCTHQFDPHYTTKTARGSGRAKAEFLEIGPNRCANLHLALFKERAKAI